MTTRYQTPTMRMKGWLTASGFTAECEVTSNPTGGWLIYYPSPKPPDGAYTLTFADEKISPVRARCSDGVCKVIDA
jgi:hypothetical protein